MLSAANRFVSTSTAPSQVPSHCASVGAPWCESSLGDSRPRCCALTHGLDPPRWQLRLGPPDALKAGQPASIELLPDFTYVVLRDTGEGKRTQATGEVHIRATHPVLSRTGSLQLERGPHGEWLVRPLSEKSIQLTTAGGTTTILPDGATELAHHSKLHPLSSDLVLTFSAHAQMDTAPEAAPADIASPTASTAPLASLSSVQPAHAASASHASSSWRTRKRDASSSPWLYVQEAHEVELELHQAERVAPARAPNPAFAICRHLAALFVKVCAPILPVIEMNAAHRN
jgi:hypothetical protein